MREVATCPADCRLTAPLPWLCIAPWLQCDQAALTGESLPVKKFSGDVCFAGEHLVSVVVLMLFRGV